MGATAQVTLVTEPAERERVARTVLEALPEWFSIPESRDAYVRESAAQPFLAACVAGAPVGFLSLAQTGTDTLEIAVMGVLREHQRQGIGRALVEAACGVARSRGFSLLQVKTVQMGRYPEYDATNRFYRALGFKDLEVFPTLWSPENPCQLYVLPLI